jgi:hypothetical protein
MRRLVLVAILAGALLAPAGPAAADADVNQRVRIAFAGGYVGVATAAGRINSVGVVTEQSTLNADGTFHGTLAFQFPLGWVTAPYRGAVTEVHVEPTTCQGRFATVGEFTLAAGTGAYAGISGHGRFSEQGIFNAVPTLEGCSPTLQVRTLLATEATATVSLPHRLGLLGL